jgi:aminoglycoside phosphotransferase (APT) family kinase protein
MVSAWPQTQQNEQVLPHGDYRPGNVLWRHGKLVAVINWEDASVGDPLLDLAIGRLGIAWIFGLDAGQAFTYHYQAIKQVDGGNLPYWDSCPALRLIRLADAISPPGLPSLLLTAARTSLPVRSGTASGPSSVRHSAS